MKKFINDVNGKHQFYEWINIFKFNYQINYFLILQQRDLNDFEK